MNKFISLIFVPILLFHFSVSGYAVNYTSPVYWAEAERYKFKINDKCGLKNTAYSYAEDTSGRNFYFMFCTEDSNYSKANATNFSIHFEIYSSAADKKENFTIHLSNDDLAYEGENGLCSVAASWDHHGGVVAGYFKIYGFGDKAMTEPITVKTFLKSTSFTASGMPDDNVLVYNKSYNKSESVSDNLQSTAKATNQAGGSKTNTTKKKIYSSGTGSYAGTERKISSGNGKISSSSVGVLESENDTNPNALTIKEDNAEDTIVLSKNKVIAAAVSAVIAGAAAAMIISVVIRNKKAKSAGIHIPENNKKQ